MVSQSIKNQKFDNFENGRIKRRKEFLDHIQEFGHMIIKMTKSCKFIETKSIQTPKSGRKYTYLKE
eukprot:snap_masked-scaffold_14-processed-gene-11.17-mRNA-1 protein AED:1.00 eAED:1.00 QI:0/-1/0/0/-1/1/1/0/65